MARKPERNHEAYNESGFLTDRAHIHTHAHAHIDIKSSLGLSIFPLFRLIIIIRLPIYTLNIPTVAHRDE